MDKFQFFAMVLQIDIEVSDLSPLVVLYCSKIILCTKVGKKLYKCIFALGARSVKVIIDERNTFFPYKI